MCMPALTQTLRSIAQMRNFSTLTMVMGNGEDDRNCYRSTDYLGATTEMTNLNLLAQATRRRSLSTIKASQNLAPNGLGPKPSLFPQKRLHLQRKSWGNSEIKKAVVRTRSCQPEVAQIPCLALNRFESSIGIPSRSHSTFQATPYPNGLTLLSFLRFCRTCSSTLEGIQVGHPHR